MTIVQAIILGVVQGLTEFLPISSTAHLVIVPRILGWELDPELSFVFDVLVQLGSILAVIAYFWSDWCKMFRAVTLSLWKRDPSSTEDVRLVWLIVLATIPAVICGLMFKEGFQEMLGNSRGVALLLLGTAALLTIGERVSIKSHRELTGLSWIDALMIGLFQALAILPGISRSGSTVVGGLFRGLKRPSAARFSFLMAVPVMLGAAVFTGSELLASEAVGEYLLVIVVGFVVAAAVGFLSIHWMLEYLARHSLHGFAVYCTVVALIVLLSGCGSSATPTAFHKMRIGVTPSTQAIARAWVGSSERADNATIELAKYSSNRRLLKAVASGGVAAGIVMHYSSEMSLDQSLYPTPLALTSLMVLVHPSNPVQELSGKQVQSIYSGTVVDWSELGGSNGAIQVLCREDGSDARLVFDAVVMKDRIPITTAVVMPGDDAMAAYVARTPQAIGYGWIASASQDVKTVVVGESLVTPVQAVTYAQPSGVLREWLSWVQAGGQDVLLPGFTPLP